MLRCIRERLVDAVELHSLASGGSVAGRLIGDEAALDRTRAAMRRAVGLPA